MKKAGMATIRKHGVATLKKTLLAAASVSLLVPFAVHSAGAHEHGLADLRVALDGTTLLIEFESPMANLVGFEHAPGTVAQKDALMAAESRLRDSTALFVLPATASCVLADLQLESPYPQHDDHEGHDHEGHDHEGHDHEGHDHEGHDHEGHDHEGHDHEGHGDQVHADMYVVYQFECANPAALDSVEVRLIEFFPRTQTLRAQVATAAGQTSFRLSKSESRLSVR